MTARDRAVKRQIEASRPERSTWLSANAGSGKTRVLIDRVARLLLTEVDPQNILCLTYTKAAASEMQNRLFERLGRWTMLGDDVLAKELEALGHGRSLDPLELNAARRLFAQAIETPGGLKIQTIHSFCASLLRRFPLEAGLTPRFTEMEERASALLRAEIVEGIAAGPQADVLRALARHYSGETLDELTGNILKNRDAFDKQMSREKLAALFGQPADLTLEAICDQVFLGNEKALLDKLIAGLRAGSRNDVSAAEKLSQVGAFDAGSLKILEDVFLTGSSANEPFSAKIGSFPTRATREKLLPIMSQIDQWMLRVEAGRNARISLLSIERTQSLHDFAEVFLRAYDRAKQMRGWLDFDDLILRARDLLSDPSVAAWVLYRLDGGIDHILVDEAQDTSPVQWQVIERLAEEFTAGHGRSPDMVRTIFVVGDKKQSIYSFQGADAREFDRMHREFEARLSGMAMPLQSLVLDHSFRSSPAILDVVDHCFEGRSNSGFTPDQPHKAFHEDLPGRVDLWPVVEAPPKDDPAPWYLPVDIRGASDPRIVLAREIASSIRRMITSGVTIPDKTDPRGYRRLQPGDFMILVRKRSHLFHAIIRECKVLELPVAGADRLKVGAELAVRDLAALLSFLSTPADDLSLAVALRSPLFSWTEGQLYDLAQGREKRALWQEMVRRAEDFPETLALLNDLRAQVDYLRPFELIERILTRHDGRRKLLARLGSEAEDGIDALLSQAMAYEKRGVDSLTGFLVWMETDDLEIKRQIDGAGNKIRVMTVHGAKGLQSPVVILPDTDNWKAPKVSQILKAEGMALWAGSVGEMPPLLQGAAEEERVVQTAERDRLLYVAMTRAETWLILAAGGDTGESWYDTVKAGMLRAGATPYDFPLGQGLRKEFGSWIDRDERPLPEPAPLEGTLQPCFQMTARAPNPAQKTLSPSDLPGPKALPGESGQDEAAAKRHGRQIHLLLETLAGLPSAEWHETGARILSTGADSAFGEELERLLAEVRNVLERPEIKPLFLADALVETSVSGHIDLLGGRRVHGTIDRLLVNEERVLAIDFKTNAIVPDTPEDCPAALLGQMGAYALLLAQIYPERRVETAFLWTREARLMPLSQQLVTDALLRAALIP